MCLHCFCVALWARVCVYFWTAMALLKRQRSLLGGGVALSVSTLFWIIHTLHYTPMMLPSTLKVWHAVYIKYSNIGQTTVISCYSSHMRVFPCWPKINCAERYLDKLYLSELLTDLDQIKNANMRNIIYKQATIPNH